MATQLFVNLPVKDLDRAIKFFVNLGFDFNAQFTDENATCMIISENSFVMLLVEKFFTSFTPGREIANTQKSTEVIVALSAESRNAVDKMIDNVLSAGGKEYREIMDHGWMYGRAFQDLDGHIWEVFYMDKSKMPEEMKNKEVL